MKMPLALIAALFAAAVLPASAQFKMQTPAGEAPGPWLFATVGVGKNADGSIKTTALKGLAVKLGEKGAAAICYDLDLCRVAGGWTGGKFTTPVNLMTRGEYPMALGDVVFTSGEVPGFLPVIGKAAISADDKWKDPRSEPFGPLPDVRYRGSYVNGNRVVVKWNIAGTEVLEAPDYVAHEKGGYFTRTFQVAASKQPILLIIAGDPNTEEGAPFGETTHRIVKLDDPALAQSGRLIQTTPWVKGATGEAMVWAAGEPEGAVWRKVAGQLCIEIPKLDKAHTFHVAIWAAPANDPNGMDSPLSYEAPDVDFPSLIGGGSQQWPEEVTTTGDLSGVKDQAYVVDTIKLPEQNPWNAPLFIGGFDFFPDGRAALCTFHGDIYVVSGIDATLEKVTWKRFATGLFQPLGLKIVNGEIMVSGRDGITRLRDLNKDGEADFYEVFNWDIKVTKNFHEFVFDLQTDPFGNFYFAKAGPIRDGDRGFEQIMEHHGCLFRVSPDGKIFQTVATGFRAPNGVCVAPDGEISTGDNEGTWVPASKINRVKASGFYGVMDLAHQQEPPEDYDRPLCWLPRRIDNSPGSQVWVTTDKWGPWRGKMLHLSYGTCSLFGVMEEELALPDSLDCCDRINQGGVVRFPVQFSSGAMRGRFHPRDGQLYVTGLRGWQTKGLSNGCFQRVRYTGAPVTMPVELRALKGGVELTFSSPIDTKAAADPDSWNVEVWNYIWSSAYGSPEISTIAPVEAPIQAGNDGRKQYTPTQMKKSQHDPMTVKSVSIGTDERTVFLEIPGMKPVMQMAIKYQIKKADGTDLNGEVVNTIHALGE